ncbi:MAG: alpha/beta fold hydrolase [Pseudomonadota bacterium]
MTDTASPRRWTPLTLAAVVLPMMLIYIAIMRIDAANADLEITKHQVGPTPVTVYWADAAPRDGAMPVVIIAHGFAGSQQLMQPFAVTLAKSGYVAVTFDFYGHGRNLRALAGDVTEVEGATRELVVQMGEVVDWARRLPGTGRGLSLLGHSMASDVVVRYAQQDLRVDGTVAVSMFSPAVTADSPGNLLVIVGGLERFLKQEALRVLGLVTDDPVAGVTVGDFDEGTARRVAVAGGVEHVGVLYSVESMREASQWLNTMNRMHPPTYADARGLAIVLLVLGIVLLAWPLSRVLPTVSEPAAGAALHWKQLLPAALIPAIGTPLLLAPFPADFLGVLVGGYLAVHFLVYGVLTALCLWWLGRGRVGPKRTTNWVALGVAAVAATAYVAGVVAWFMDAQVTSFAITPPRVPIALTMFAGTLCYFLTDEWLTRGAGHARGGHLFTRFCFLLSLGLAVALSFEDLFFLVIIAGIIVIYFFVYGLFSRWIYSATGHPAVSALANAVAFAWALAAVFPMLSG